MATAMRYPPPVAEIKCTNCGMAFDMAHAADHLCQTPAPAPLHPMDRFNNAFSSMKVQTNAPFPFPLRPNPPASQVAPTLRPPPSMINASAAQESSRGGGMSAQLDSADWPAQPNPRFPADPVGGRPPFRMPPRAASAPRVPLRSPSPERPLPQDCAFPTFPLPQHGLPAALPVPESASGTPPHSLGLPPGLRPTTSHGQAHTESLPHAPALAPGLRPPTRDSSEGRAASTTPTMMGRSGSPTQVSNFARPLPPADRPRFESTSSYGSRPRSPSDSSTPPIPPYSQRRHVLSPDPGDNLRLPFSGSPSSTNESERSRSTSPQHVDESVAVRPPASLGHFRKPSQSAATRPLHEIGSIKTHRLTLSRSCSPPKNGPDMLLPYSARIVDERSDSRLEDAPPVPFGPSLHAGDEINRSQSAPPTRDQFMPFQPPPMPSVQRSHELSPNNGSFHSPTESLSSNGSVAHTISSRSSPPTSATFATDRKESQGEGRAIEGFSFGRQGGFKAHPPPPLTIPSDPRSVIRPALSPRSAPGMGVPQPHSPNPMVPMAPSAVHGASEQGAPSSAPKGSSHIPTLSITEAPSLAPTTASESAPNRRRRPVKSFSRPHLARPAGVAEAETESPIDPALHNGRLPGFPSNGPTPPAFEPQPLRSPQTAPPFTNGSRRDAFPPRNESYATQPASAGPGPAPVRRATTGLRSACRGCGEAIQGKAVTSADGRLPGRWHRACFVCKTCASPFDDGAFYVFGSQAYCARHYHQLNRTLCAGCDRGIEGVYVETDSRVKFHPECFCCQVCVAVLRHVHYEDPVSGAILCEHHALENAQRLGPNRRNPERRTTRMMMN